MSASLLLFSIKILLTTPNLNLLTAILTLLRFLNDISFFKYHRKSYDPEFALCVDIAYDLENGKWMPDRVVEAAKSADVTYAKYISVANFPALPTSYEDAGDTYHFLVATEDVWLWSVPVASLVFVAFYCVRKRLTNDKLRRLLAKYSSFSLLAVSLLSESIQFFSFRGFTQLSALSVASRNSAVDFVNMLACYIKLLLIFCYPVASPWVYGTVG